MVKRRDAQPLPHPTPSRQQRLVAAVERGSAFRQMTPLPTGYCSVQLIKKPNYPVGRARGAAVGWRFSAERFQSAGS